MHEGRRLLLRQRRAQGDDHLQVDRFRQILAEQRKAGKAVGYLSVPLTSAGGGNFDINKEVAESAKAAIESASEPITSTCSTRHARRRPAEGHRAPTTC
jgi:hypothetical protein